MEKSQKRPPKGVFPPSWAFLLIGTALYWSWALFSGFKNRAFDTADPLMQMINAYPSVLAARSGQWLEALALTSHDATGRPLLNFLLFLGPALNLGDGLSWHYLVCGISTLLFAVLAVYCAARFFGNLSGWIFAIFLAGSGLMLQYALAGGHNWIGQFFFWSALFAADGWRMATAEGPVCAERSEHKRGGRSDAPQPALRPYLSGVLVALSVAASYHMFPLAAGFFLVLFWRHRFQKEFLASATAFAGVLLVWTLIGFAVPGKSYLPLLWENISIADQSAGKFPAGPLFFPHMLWSGENVIFLLLAALGIGRRMATAEGPVCAERSEHKRGGRSQAPAALFFLPPAFMLLFLELSGMLKLGRIYLPLLPFLLLLASLGLSSLIQKINSSSGRAVAAAALAAILILPGLSKRQDTWRAFHAAPEIQKLIFDSRLSTPDSRLPSIVVAGFQLPHTYFPWEEQRETIDTARLIRNEKGALFYIPDNSERVILRSDLKKLIDEGLEWVFLSYFSTWEWQSFIEDKAAEVIPAKNIYASPAPFIAVPGVENTEFQIFSNEALYHGIKTKRLPFPIENRLYRAKDLLPWLQ